MKSPFERFKMGFLKRMMSSHSKPKVTVSQGTVVGAQGALLSGKVYYSFKGIPYAFPPIGNLRFEPPIPLKTFSSLELDCTKERSVSFQRDPLLNEFSGSEDCLFLNVHTPRRNVGEMLPVMVFIHGGGFAFGSGNSDMYNPLYLLEEDVVIVTLNYRLGYLGFLSYPEGCIGGNCGLKDQALALEWVQENIQQFNGDPHNVTLFGESAGAASAHLHMYSEKSKKLFHKAILQSGCCNMQWCMQLNPSYKAEYLARNLGFQGTDPKELVNFLKDPKITPVAMFPFAVRSLTPDERRRDIPLPLGPVVEPQSVTAIVTEDPLHSMSIKNNLNIPLMMGYNSSEGIVSLPAAVKKLDEFDKDLARLIPRALNIDIDGEEGKAISQQIREFYFKGEKLNEGNLQSLCDILSDYHFVIGTYKYAETHVRYQHRSPLYLYRFDYDGALGFYKKLFGFEDLKGVSHADELFYLFQTEFQKLSQKELSADTKMIKQICRMWTNFAKFSDPTPSTDNDLLGFKWSPVKQIGDGNKDEFVLDYLNITSNSRMEQHPDKERMLFWENIFKTWNKDYLKPKL